MATTTQLKLPPFQANNKNSCGLNGVSTVPDALKGRAVHPEMLRACIVAVAGAALQLVGVKVSRSGGNA